MTSQKCPICGSPEIKTEHPRTPYECGSSDYDQRPATFMISDSCKAKAIWDCNRDLYDFFDKQKIVINTFDNTGTARSWQFVIWVDGVLMPGENTVQPTYPDRKACEVEAFGAAFILLQKQPS